MNVAAAALLLLCIQTARTVAVCMGYCQWFLFIHSYVYMWIARIFLEFLILWTFQRFYFIDRILLHTEYGMSCKIFTPNEARKIIHELELAFVAKRNTRIKATAIHIPHCDNSISSFVDFHWSPLIFREISVLFVQWKVKAARLCSALCKSSIQMLEIKERPTAEKYIPMYHCYVPASPRQTLYLSRVSAATLCLQSNLWMNFRIMRRKPFTRNGLVFYANNILFYPVPSRTAASPLLSNQRPGGMCTWYTRTEWLLLCIWWRWNVNFRQLQLQAGQKP